MPVDEIVAAVPENVFVFTVVPTVVGVTVNAGKVPAAVTFGILRAV